MSRQPPRQDRGWSIPPQGASPQDAPAALAARQARHAAKLLAQQGIGSGARVLDLGCGYGLQAQGLARAGYRVLGIDIRCEPDLLDQWRLRSTAQKGLHLLAADARHLPLRSRFAAALLLNNGLSLFAANQDAIALFGEVRRHIAPDGLFLLDNVCLDLWREIAAGHYANGLSEDGLWQMAWLPGRNVFALRYGEQIRPNHPRPRPGEPLYRAWSLDELDLLLERTGWQRQAQTQQQKLLVARPVGARRT